MIHERGLDLQRGDLIAGAYDHVVGAALVPEVAVSIHAVSVPGQVPAILHVLALLLGRVQVAAAGQSAYREPPNGVGGNRLAGLIHHLSFKSWNRLACRAGTD